ASPTSTARSPTPGATWSRSRIPAGRPTRPATADAAGVHPSGVALAARGRRCYPLAMDILTSIRSSFADEYDDARRLFLGAATAAGAGLTAWENPLPGPQGEALTTDVAWIGPQDAGRVLVLIS